MFATEPARFIRKVISDIKYSPTVSRSKFFSSVQGSTLIFVVGWKQECGPQFSDTMGSA
jgi:hypothetical protein